MSYGFCSKNVNNVVQIDENYVNYSQYSRGFIQTNHVVANPTTESLLFIRATAANASIAYAVNHLQNTFIILSGYWSSTQFIYTTRQVEYVILTKIPNSDAALGFGMDVFGPSGVLVYSSNSSPIINIKTVTTQPAGQNFLVNTTPAGTGKANFVFAGNLMADSGQFYPDKTYYNSVRFLTADSFEFLPSYVSSDGSSADGDYWRPLLQIIGDI